MPTTPGWSPEQVKEHLLVILDERDKAVRAALAAAEKAIGVAEVNSEKWRANANEWRAAMSDRENRFAAKSEISLQMQSVNDRLNTLELARASNIGKGTSYTMLWAVAITVINLVLAGIGLLRQL